MHTKFAFIALTFILLGALTATVFTWSTRRSTEQRSRATSAGLCIGTKIIDRSPCSGGCLVDADCVAGLSCLKQTTASEGICRLATNPTSTTCLAN